MTPRQRRGAAHGRSAVLIPPWLGGPTARRRVRRRCDTRANNPYAKLLEFVTLEGVRQRMLAFQKIAESNDDPYYPGFRAAGTEGYDQSVEYVAGLLREAGCQVTLGPVDFTFNFPAVLHQLTPTAADHETGAFTGSGAGRVQCNVIAVDINLTGTRANSSGREAADFAPYDWSGMADIALLQRGTCNFGQQVAERRSGGAEAVIIFNQGAARIGSP